MDLAKSRLSRDCPLGEGCFASARAIAAIAGGKHQVARRSRPSRTVLQPGDRVCRALQVRNSERAGVGILSLEHRKLDEGASSSMRQSTSSCAILPVPYWASCKKIRF